MAYFGNGAVNRVNIHAGIVALANGAGGIFFMAVLLRAGLTLPEAMLAQAAIFAGRFIIRPLMVPLGVRWGLKPLMYIGTFGMALQFPALPAVSGVGPALVVLVVVTAVSEVFYYAAYHTYFATLGDVEARGSQIAAREAMAAAANVVAPLIGAWALVATGPWITFIGVAVVQALAAVPLIGIRNVPVRKEAPGVLHAARLGAMLFALDGWYAANSFFFWQAALFLALGSNYAAFGGAMALSGLVGAAYGLFHGRSIDTGHGRRAVVVAFSAAATIIVFRAISLPYPWLAVIANATVALVPPLYQPTQGTALYNIGKAAPCPFRFNVALEGAWDSGCVIFCLVAAGLITLGVPLSVVMLLALPGLGTAARLLWRYYGRVVEAGMVEAAA
jgi:hypothetical protein